MAITPQMAIYGISAISSIVGGKKQKRRARAAAAQAREDREKQRAILEQQKEEYRSFEFSNPYIGMENVYEDLTINQQQAQFQSQQGAQQRANILGQLRGAAGSSGIAGLAQSLANQGQLQTQQISASIGQQEAMNQKLRAQGASAVDLAERQGDAMLQEAESGREATILGMEYGLMAGENEAYQQSLKNFQEAQASQMKMRADAFKSFVKMTDGKSWDDFKLP